jgi:glycerol uptake facilitator-like aquaporin
LGSAALAAIVIGSGVMAERMAGGNGALALLANTFATAAGLYALIVVLSPVSGAHFNPAVTLARAVRGEIEPREACAFVAAQVAGMLGGVLLAHAMFGLPAWYPSTHARAGWAQGLSEGVATFMLVLAILGTRRRSVESVAAAVALTIAAGYWFTASTSFANPAITLARALSDTFAGIRMADVPMFIVGQLAGCLVAVACARWLFDEKESIAASASAQRGR